MNLELRLQSKIRNQYKAYLIQNHRERGHHRTLREYILYKIIMVSRREVNCLWYTYRAQSPKPPQLSNALFLNITCKTNVSFKTRSNPREAPRGHPIWSVSTRMYPQREFRKFPSIILIIEDLLNAPVWRWGYVPWTRRYSVLSIGGIGVHSLCIDGITKWRHKRFIRSLINHQWKREPIRQHIHCGVVIWKNQKFPSMFYHHTICSKKVLHEYWTI